MKKSEVETMLVNIVNASGIRYMEDIYTKQGKYAVDVNAIKQFLRWLESQEDK